MDYVGIIMLRQSCSGNKLPVYYGMSLWDKSYRHILSPGGTTQNSPEIHFRDYTGNFLMPLITIRETADFDQSPNAVVSFDRQEFPITVKDPFSEKEEKLLEWYFEEYLKFPFTKQVEYQEADQSVTTYGESLFAQIFGGNPKIFAKYSQAIVTDTF